MPEDAPKSIARSLGEFFGHIVKGVKAPTPPPDAPKGTREVKREIIEEEQDGMILRRTTIEEIEIPPSSESPDV